MLPWHGCGARNDETLKLNPQKSKLYLFRQNPAPVSLSPRGAATRFARSTAPPLRIATTTKRPLRLRSNQKSPEIDVKGLFLSDAFYPPRTPQYGPLLCAMQLPEKKADSSGTDPVRATAAMFVHLLQPSSVFPCLSFPPKALARNPSKSAECFSRKLWNPTQFRLHFPCRAILTCMPLHDYPTY